MFGRKNNDSKAPRHPVQERKTDWNGTFYEVPNDPSQKSYRTRGEAERRARALDNRYSA
ncbi:hypothetical protein [Streptomyces decoyicus]|uniref:hypothetical protein n=1 Tax=Streptomyces decoyicus TaxID=249567 RepID=UPI003800BBBE